jgi:hypothetical protein
VITDPTAEPTLQCVARNPGIEVRFGCRGTVIDAQINCPKFVCVD